MTLIHADNIIQQIVNQSSYRVERRESVSTSSIYYKLYSSSGQSLIFRIADHGTQKDIITLRVDKKISDQNVKAFVKNRISDLGKRVVKTLLCL